MYHITCTRLSAVAATSGSLAALGDIIISQLTFCSESKVNGVIGANDVITADREFAISAFTDRYQLL